MTDNEIIKALECCSNYNECDKCNFEPKDNKKKTIGCCLEIMKESLAIINRQQAEIDRLKKEKENKMKPKDAHQDGAYWCPNCVRVIKPRIENCKIKIKYCPFCGQALDWSDTE